MLLFGHRFLDKKEFFHIFSVDSIEKTPPSSELYVEFDENNLDIIEHMRLNHMRFGLYVHNLTEVIYASALGATYIVVEKELAKSAQGIAENYLFDAKILVHITQEEEIEEMALLGIDGVIFPEAVVKISS